MMMTLHQNSHAFQALRGRAVHFMSGRNRRGFAPGSRSAMTRAFDAGVMIVGTDGHSRYHLPRRTPVQDILWAQRCGSYSDGYGIYRHPEKGVRFISAHKADMSKLGGVSLDPTGIVLVAAGKPALSVVPDHGNCLLDHYTYDPETDALTALTYVPTAPEMYPPRGVLFSCQYAMEATEPGTVTDDERRVLRLGDPGMGLFTTEGWVVVQGLTRIERLLTVSHGADCRQLLTLIPGILSEQWSSLTRHRSSSVVGFPLGEDKTQRFYLEYDPVRLLRWESQRIRMDLNFPDASNW